MDVETNIDRTEGNLTLSEGSVSDAKVALPEKKKKKKRKHAEVEGSSSDSVTVITDNYDNSEQLITGETAGPFEEEKRKKKKKKKKKKHSSHETGNSPSAKEAEGIGAPVDLSSHKPPYPTDPSTSRYSDFEGETYENPEEEIPTYTNPEEEIPRYSDLAEEISRYSGPPEEIPGYSGPSEEIPIYSVPPEEMSIYSGPPEKIPRYSGPPEEIPRFSDPPGRSRRYSGSPEKIPRYSGPPEEIPRFSDPPGRSRRYRGSAGENPRYSGSIEAIPRYSHPVEEIPINDQGLQIVIKKRKRRTRHMNSYEEIPPLPPPDMHPQEISTDEISVTICQGNKTDKRKRKKRNPPRRSDDSVPGGAGDHSPVDLSSHKTAGFINPSTSKQSVVVSEEHLFTGQYTKELYRKILAAEVEALKNESQDEPDEQDENMFEKDEKLPSLEQYLNTSLEEGDPFVPSFTGDPICPYCNKVFSKPAHRNHHVKAVHLKIKPYKCSVCGKAFSEKQTLKVHGFLHTDEKRFECHLCDTSFRNVSNLYQHQKTHINSTMELDNPLKPRRKKLNSKFPGNFLELSMEEDDSERPVEVDLRSREGDEGVEALRGVMSNVDAMRGVMNNAEVVMNNVEAVREM